MATFYLQAAAPFRLDLTAWALRRLPVNSIDKWDGRSYSRVFSINGNAVAVSADETGTIQSPEVRVYLDGPSRFKGVISEALHKVLGLDIDLTAFYELATRHRQLDSLVKRFIGLKPPRFPSVFEALVNGISCQQISLTVGIRLLNRLSAAYGASRGESHAFPLPEDLQKAAPQELRKLGYSTRKAENIIAISKAVYRRDLDLDSLEHEADQAATTRLQKLDGVGRWTAEYIMLRGLGRLDIFPGDDVGGQKRLMRWLGLEERPDYEGTNKALEKWSPYRGMLYFHLLLNERAENGLIEERPGWRQAS
jgi:DNA-3-methyladenine glycosylase II